MTRIISIHAPLTGSDTEQPASSRMSIYFNPRSPYGERRALPPGEWPTWTFQSTLPLRGATPKSDMLLSTTIFQSTLPLRGATCGSRKKWTDKVFQSTLPLRGATLGRPVCFLTPCDFNPRSPYGERLGAVECFDDYCADFNPRSPYGERPCTWSFSFKQQIISIHAPLTGSDGQPTASAPWAGISIHAPLTGSDGTAIRQTGPDADFNPRSPYGERQPPALPQGKQWQFQSTLPLRGATDLPF